MTAKQYVNSIVKKIKCDGGKRKDIGQQLLTDINLRMSKGETLEEIISQMGSANEIAEGYNENISEKEQKRYKRNKVIKNAILIVLLLAVLSGLTYWKMPKAADIEKSKYFDKAQVEAVMKQTIEQLDAGEYETLKKNSISQMEQFLNQESAQEIRASVSEDDWGQRSNFGPAYIAELSQGNDHFAVGEITVTYENISVTYRLTYDQDMRLAGLYVR